jgi:hypothetical protein
VIDNDSQVDKIDLLNNKLIQIDAKLEKIQSENQFFNKLIKMTWNLLFIQFSIIFITLI